METPMFWTLGRRVTVLVWMIAAVPYLVDRTARRLLPTGSETTSPHTWNVTG
jgi:hypothetical protein